MAAPRLSAEEIQSGLTQLEDWHLEDDKLVRRLKFDSFLDAIDFITRIAPIAEAADHHPEIFNVYNTIELAMTTHDSQGITHKDFDLAEQIDRVV